MSEEGFEFQSLEELADAMEQQTEGPPAVEVWQDYDPSQRFIAVFPLTPAQGAAASTVAYFIFEPGRHSGLHADNAEEVIYCADGVGEVFVSGKQVKLEPGEFVVVNAGVQHDVYAYGSVELRLLSFFPAAVVDAWHCRFAADVVRLVLPAADSVRALLHADVVSHQLDLVPPRERSRS